MAGEWIKMRMDLQEDPTVFRLVAITKSDRYSVIGRLHSFWSWADKHAVDGRVDGATSHVVDAVVSHDGFAAALESVKWLEIGADFIAIPRHERHNGESAKERSLKNQRQARWRDGRRKGGGKPSTPPSTDASTREEKRRSTPIAPTGGFLKFWGAWPKSARKQSRGPCWDRWRKADIDLVADDVIAHVEAMKLSIDWRKDGGAFIPAPLVYLNQRRWEGADLSLGGEKRMVV